MPAQPPTKLPETRGAKSGGDKSREENLDRFRPDMPQIPGVGGGAGARPSQSGLAGIEQQRLLQIAVIAGVALLVAGMVFWNVRGKSQPAAPTTADTPEQSAPEPVQKLPAPAPAATNIAGTVEELSKPWASRKFTFLNPLTQENIPSMVIHLPSGQFWGFSLRAPFGRCQLEFVTDVAAIASQYRFNASHPMVVNPCDGTVYDPLKVGPLGANTWARGEIVKGSSLRPPISIDVKVQGRSVIADGIE
jgi:hypothetical protein